MIPLHSVVVNKNKNKNMNKNINMNKNNQNGLWKIVGIDIAKFCT